MIDVFRAQALRFRLHRVFCEKQSPSHCYISQSENTLFPWAAFNFYQIQAAGLTSVIIWDFVLESTIIFHRRLWFLQDSPPPSPFLIYSLIESDTGELGLRGKSFMLSKLCLRKIKNFVAGLFLYLGQSSIFLSLHEGRSMFVCCSSTLVLILAKVWSQRYKICPFSNMH